MAAVGVAELAHPALQRDERGYAHEFTAPHRVERVFEATSRRGVFRGMHFQDWRVAPLWKTLTVIVGSVRDYVFDLRDGRQWIERYELASDKPAYLTVPPHCAHGYVVTSDVATVLYLMSDRRSEGAERVIHYSSLGIALPRGSVLSQKDSSAPPLEQVLRALRRPI